MVQIIHISDFHLDTNPISLKKEALINGEYEKLLELSRNYSQYGKPDVLVNSKLEDSLLVVSSSVVSTGSTTAPSVVK